MQASQVTVGILAGGRATRLGGLDKAWLSREGVPQVLWLARRFGPGSGALLVSANAGLDRYAGHGLATVVDRLEGVGPIAGLQSLAKACATPWLLTVPVDIVAIDAGLRSSLASAGGAGAVAEDDEGLQPLVALYRVDAMRLAIDAALAAGEHAVHALQDRLRMPRIRFRGVRFGNLNTPGDLRRAGIDVA